MSEAVQNNLDNPVVPIEDAPKPQSFAEAAEAYMKNIDVLQPAPVQQSAPVQQPAPTETEKVTQQEATKDVVEILKGMGVTQFDSPEKFAKSYVENRAWNTRVSQENATLKKTVEDLQAKFQQFEQQGTQQTQVQQEDYDPQEDINKFYENPKAFMESYAKTLADSLKNELKKEITPVQERFVQQTAKEAQESATRKFFADIPDAQEFMPKMAELLQEDVSFMGLTDPQTVYDRLNDTLTYVKGLVYQKPPSTEDLLKQALENEELFSKYIAGNEAVKNKLLSQAVQQIQQNQPPPFVANPAAAQIIPKPAEKASTFEQLGESIKKALGLG